MDLKTADPLKPTSPFSAAKKMDKEAVDPQHLGYLHRLGVFTQARV